MNNIDSQESKEELKKRLREKINNKKNNRTISMNGKTKKKMNDSFENLTNILKKNNIENPDQIDENIMNEIMNSISKQDLELIINKIKDNSQLNELLNTIKNKIN